MRWLPVTFTIGTLYFSATSAILRSSAGRGDAAAHSRDDGERAVLLNIGVNAIVDEAGRAVLFVIAAPDHVDDVAERRLADLAALAVAVDVEHFLHGPQLLRAHDVAQFLLRKRHARAEDFLLVFFELRRDGLQQVARTAWCNCRSRWRRGCGPSAGPWCRRRARGRRR